jgi:hypothetical protein
MNRKDVQACGSLWNFPGAEIDRAAMNAEKLRVRATVNCQGMTSVMPQSPPIRFGFSRWGSFGATLNLSYEPLHSSAFVAAEPRHNGGSPRIYSGEERFSAPKTPPC